MLKGSINQGNGRSGYYIESENGEEERFVRLPFVNLSPYSTEYEGILSLEEWENPEKGFIVREQFLTNQIRCKPENLHQTPILLAPYIDVIDRDRAEGRLKEIYDDIVQKRGKLAEVHKIQSLNPESIVHHMDLYMTIMFGKSPLSRAQREMIAVVVSSANRCAYCIQHHSEPLAKYWKDEAKVDQLARDYSKLELQEKDRLYCELAERLTHDPSGTGYEQAVGPLKQAGASDREVLDAVLIISYFNFVNRVVMGLGVEASPEEVKGYKD